MKKIKLFFFTCLCLGFLVSCNLNMGGNQQKTTYTVTFQTEDGIEVGKVEVEENSLVEEPAVGDREGYEFIGWFLESEQWNFETNTVTSNIILKSKWQEVKNEATVYTVNLNPNGGTLDEKVIEFTDYKDVVLPIPSRDNYTFIGWYKGTVKYDSLTENENYFLIAQWMGTSYNITYHLDGGVLNTLSKDTYNFGSGLILYAPTKEGYNFEGWYDNPEFTGSKITRISTTDSGDKDLYAKWVEQQPVITYELNGGNWSYTTREAIVEEFLKDAMTWGGKTTKPDGMVSGTNGTHSGFANVFSSIYGIFSDSQYKAKWAWLKAYIIEATDNVSSKGYLESGNEAFWRYSLGAFLFEEFRDTYPISADYTDEQKANGFWDTLSEYEVNEFEITSNGLLTPVRIYYVFEGWYDNPEFTGNPITSVTTDTKLYAKWVEETPVEKIEITNKVTNLDRFEEYQLEWEITPSNAAIKSVEFSSSDETIATVSNTGLITPLNNGTVTITIKSLSPSGKTDTVTIIVSSPDHFRLAYKTESYMKVSETIELVAEYVKRNGGTEALVWESLNSDIATVNNGVVTGIKVGVATIRVKLASDATVYADFVVTVLPDELSEELEFIVNEHESNIFTRYDLGIGAGTPVYDANIFGGVSQYLFNYDYFWNTKYLDTTMKNGQYSKNLTDVKFITVHYTAGMTKGSNAEATANYFSYAQDVSAHFCTGNDGVFQSLELNVRGWHAGDGTGTTFTWTNTGVKYDPNDPRWPEWGISENAMFTINGQETSVKVPEKTQRGNEGFVTDSKWLNDQGLAFTIIDGYYYMGTTWWCYSNVYEGRICSKGGNNNSIGIESAVDEGSDLWLTWQITARLVADLLIKYDLDITRVVGHHFFAAKDCPQPLLENDLEIWWEFIELVEAEYEKMKSFNETEIKFTVTKGQDIVNEHGRVYNQPEFSQIVTYEVEINGELVTLATCVPGMYTK